MRAAEANSRTQLGSLLSSRRSPRNGNRQKSVTLLANVTEQQEGGKFVAAHRERTSIANEQGEIVGRSRSETDEWIAALGQKTAQ